MTTVTCAIAGSLVEWGLALAARPDAADGEGGCPVACCPEQAVRHMAASAALKKENLRLVMSNDYPGWREIRYSGTAVRPVENALGFIPSSPLTQFFSAMRQNR